jgi:hypothetical protein
MLDWPLVLLINTSLRLHAHSNARTRLLRLASPNILRRSPQANRYTLHQLGRILMSPPIGMDENKIKRRQAPTRPRIPADEVNQRLGENAYAIRNMNPNSTPK